MLYLTREQWDSLEELLNKVANEREQDSDGPGSFPTYNARKAMKMIQDLGMERCKPAYIT